VRVAALAALAAAALILGGCGSSKTVVTKGRSVSKVAFIASADAICRSSESALAPVLARETATLSAKPQKVAAGAQALDAASAIIRNGVGQLRSLAEPSSDTKKLAKMVGALNNEAAALSAYARALRSHNTAAQATEASEITAFSTLYSGIARSYGFKRCGHG
jgi:uncharacterized phage infection (PIP) family protein YhgE